VKLPKLCLGRGAMLAILPPEGESELVKQGRAYRVPKLVAGPVRYRSFSYSTSHRLRRKVASRHLLLEEQLMLSYP